MLIYIKIFLKSDEKPSSLGKKNALQKDLNDSLNIEKRKNDRNYSDLFGREAIKSNTSTYLIFSYNNNISIIQVKKIKLALL